MIVDIFDARTAKNEFRRIETEMIRMWVHKVEQGMPSVIALGGGAFRPAGESEFAGEGSRLFDLAGLPDRRSD